MKSALSLIRSNSPKERTAWCTRFRVSNQAGQLWGSLGFGKRRPRRGGTQAGPPGESSSRVTRRDCSACPTGNDECLAVLIGRSTMIVQYIIVLAPSSKGGDKYKTGGARCPEGWLLANSGSSSCFELTYMLTCTVFGGESLGTWDRGECRYCSASLLRLLRRCTSREAKVE